MATKAEREAYEAERESLPSWRMRRRWELERHLTRLREREEILLVELGGRRSPTEDA